MTKDELYEKLLEDDRIHWMDSNGIRLFRTFVDASNKSVSSDEILALVFELVDDSLVAITFNIDNSDTIRDELVARAMPLTARLIAKLRQNNAI